MKRIVNILCYRLDLLRSSSLHANSLYIMAAQGLVTVFGFLFWLIIARLFDAEDVGLAGSLISVATLITNIAMLGLNNALVRFLPKARDKNELINTSLMVVFIASIVSAIIYTIGLKAFSPKLLFVTHEPLLLTMFLLSMVLVAVNTFTDSIFLANRATKYNIVIYFAYSLLRLVTPVAVASLGVTGIFAAHMAGVAAAVSLSLLFMFGKLGWRPSPRISWLRLKQMAGYSFANYLAGFMWSAPLLIAPLMVVNHLGASSAAYFYMVMMIINMLLIIPTAASQSLFAEGSHADDNQLANLVKKSLKTGSILMVLAVAGVLAVGKFAIGIFGEEYASGGAGAMFVMSAACLLVVINMTGNVVLKVRKQILTLIAINALGAVATIALFPMLITEGLIGIGYAYFIGQLLMAVTYAGAWTASLIFSSASSTELAEESR